jgi:hypothetical protein
MEETEAAYSRNNIGLLSAITSSAKRGVQVSLSGDYKIGE